MTLAGFVRKNAFRNPRRSELTVLSIAFSLLLHTLMLTIWRTFYIDQGAPQSAQRLLLRRRTSLANFLPGAYRQQIRAVPGVTAVAPMTWFGGMYMDDKPENAFAQFATDPLAILQAYPENHVTDDQLQAWTRDRAGCMVDAKLAEKPLNAGGWGLPECFGGVPNPAGSEGLERPPTVVFATPRVQEAPILYPICRSPFTISVLAAV